MGFVGWKMCGLKFLYHIIKGLSLKKVPNLPIIQCTEFGLKAMVLSLDGAST